MRQDISKQTAIKEINIRKLIYFSYFFVMKINQKPHIKALLLRFTEIFLILPHCFFLLPYFCVCYYCLLSCKKVFPAIAKQCN